MFSRLVTRLINSHLIFFFLFSCDFSPQKLPILGYHQYHEKIIDNQKIVDTVYHKISNFSFLNQDSLWISEATVKDKIYIADFFFTTCPDICPLMSRNMMDIYDKHKERKDLLILSHTIDSYNDSIPVLKDYSRKLGLEEKQKLWHFLYGKQEDIFLLAKESYLATAMKDNTAPKGIIHSGTFILVDKKRRIRGLYDGTSKKGTQQLFKDLALLIGEY